MNKPKVWLYVVIFLLAASLAGGAVLAWRNRGAEPLEIVLTSPATPTPPARVYVGGAVSSPGFFPARQADTIASLLRDAGLLPDADMSAVRLTVPRKGESQQSQRVDINRAEAWLLQALPGIGETRARAIIDHRTKNGPFNRVEDLLKVPGLGQDTLDRLRPFATVAD